MLGCQHHVGRAEDRVGTGREDTNAGIVPRYREIDLRTFGPPDPVSLHLLRAVGPVELVQPLEEFLGVLGDPQHPLPYGFSDTGVAPDIGMSVDDFFVRQRSTQFGAPPDRLLGLICETALIELEEDPLGPSVI